jgi:membrane associated rhomboid family serine protease
MFPVTDTVRSRTFPIVNVSMAGINEFFRDYGAIPDDLTNWVEDPSGYEEPTTVVTSAFLHGGWLHLIGNMLFLWVFGDNVEDAFGHMKYAVFYIVVAAAAAITQVLVDTNSFVPMIGASGAIAGVLAAYLVLYPRATVGTVVPLLWFFGPIPVPAILLIGLWFLMQLLAGWASIGGDAQGVSEGVAVFAHIGGFVAGLAIAFVMRPLLRTRPYQQVRRRRTQVL